MRVIHARLSRDMRPDLDCRSTEALIQPRAQTRLLSRRHAGPTALQTLGGKRVPADVLVGLVPAANGIVVQIKKLGDGLTGRPVIKQQERIGAPSNAVVFALTTYASPKRSPLCTERNPPGS